MLNQLENLAKCVGGNNELIDQWLQARKGLLVAYYHLIGLKPNKEKHTPLDEEALDAFAISWWIISPPGIFSFTIVSCLRARARPR